MAVATLSKCQLVTGRIVGATNLFTLNHSGEVIRNGRGYWVFPAVS